MIACTGTEPQSSLEPLGEASSALTANSVTITVTSPAGTALTGIPLSATNDIHLGDRARVQAAGSVPAPVVNSGSVITALGHDTNVGSITSKAAVTIDDRSTVTGNVTSSGSVTPGTNVTITGTVLQNTAITFDRWSWTVALPASGAPVTVPVNGSRTITAGSYAAVVAYSGATLRLSAGTYYFDSFDMEPSSRLAANTTAGTITIYVRQSPFIFRGSTIFTGPNDRLMIVYLGTTQPGLDRSFDGTFVAPNASVRLGTGGAPWNGGIFAKSVTLDPDVRLTLRAFSGWGQFGFLVEPRFDCLETRSNGSLVGYFGYRNPGTSNVTVAIGTGNRFSPGTQSRGQPTVFAPGTATKQFAITWVTHEASWFLNGIEAKPDSLKPCPTSTTFSALADTRVLASSPKENFQAITSLGAGDGESTLVQFDRASLAKEIGPNGFITSARLELTVQGAVSSPVQATAMRQGWTEAGATWSCGIDADATATGQTCTALDEWNMTPVPGTWANPWQRFAEARPANIGTVAGSVISFDVTEDAQRFLGTERVGMAPSWIVQSTGSASHFASREAGAATAPRLVISTTSITDVDTTTGGEDIAPFSFLVDAAVVPTHAPLGSIVPGGAARPLDSVRGPDGKQSDFAARELVVYTSSASELAAVQARVGGTLLYQSPIVVAGQPRPNVIQINPGVVDSSKLAQTLVARVPGLRGRQHVSSDAGLRLLAAAADESSRGTRVGLNWLADGAAFSINNLASKLVIDGNFDPVPLPPIPPGMSSNAYDWPHYAPGMHNITGAWMEAFPLSTHADYRVKVAIQDQGFAGDLVDGYNITAPFCPTSNCQNTGVCTDGNECPWHGTDVTNTGFAEPNNGRGGASPGWAVTDLTWAFGLYDPITLDTFLVSTFTSGQDIVNLSYGGDIPDWAVALTTAGTLGAALVVLEGGTWAVRHINDTLIFASAGNDNTNVDEMRCYSTKNAVTDFIAGIFDTTAPNITVCPWEKSWTWPCENAGVNCVEGSYMENRNVYPGSNYGADDVMHRASYLNIVAGNSAKDETEITTPEKSHYFPGTSGSSPLVAGIAALTWAVDLFQSANDVERCLLRAGKFVDDFDSVRCALDEPPLSTGDFAPRVQITQPKKNAEIDTTFVFLSAEAGDETGPLDIQWFVNGVAAGTSSSGDSLNYSISSTGQFAVEAIATDAGGKTGSATVTFFVPPNPAVLSIILPPRDGDTTFVGLPVDLFSQVGGRGPVPPCSPVTWSGTMNATPIFTNSPNCTQQQILESPGAAVLTTSYSDALGSSTATRTLNVVDDGLPHVKIRQPMRTSMDGLVAVASATTGAPLPLDAASTPLGTPYVYTWTITAEGQPTTTFQTTSTSATYTPSFSLIDCQVIRGSITVMISDTLGHPANDSIPVDIASSHCDPH